MVAFRQKEFRKKNSQVTVVEVSRREEKIQLCGKNLHFQKNCCKQEGELSDETAIGCVAEWSEATRRASRVVLRSGGSNPSLGKGEKTSSPFRHCTPQLTADRDKK